jgi:uncharacterized membrane protein
VRTEADGATKDRPTRRRFGGILSGGEAETGRVEAFSDGVLAIVITLLVLEIHVPQVSGGDAVLWSALLRLVPMIAAWIVSFWFVLVFWVAHHYFFDQITRVNRGLLWLNGLFLLCICFTPFPAGLQAAHPGAPPAVFLMSLAMLLTASGFSLMRWYASCVAHLCQSDIPAKALRAAMRKSLVAPTLYFVGCLAAFRLVWLAIAIQVLVPLIYFLPSVPAPNRGTR